MPGDEFAFDAYDRLVGRKSMASSPVAIVVRNPPPDRLDEIIDRCLSLLRDRRSPDEILLVLEREPARRPPSAVGAVMIRIVVLPSIAKRDGLAWTLANARWPLAVFVGAEASLPLPAFRSMLESLEHADIVVGRRRSLRGSRHPLSWLIRRLFGVGVSDPVSPFLGFRRESVADVPLELDEPLTVFELLAKSTFAFAIYDEVAVDDVAVDDVDAPPPPLHWELFSRRRDLLRLFLSPRFWRYSRESDQVRTIPQLTAPPRPRAGVVDRTGRPRVHPLRHSLLASIAENGRLPADRCR